MRVFYRGWEIRWAGDGWGALHLRTGVGPERKRGTLSALVHNLDWIEAQWLEVVFE